MLHIADKSAQDADLQYLHLTNDDTRRIRFLRAQCTACQGDPERCQAGTGEPCFDRLPGCRAFTRDGEIANLRAVKPARQPWQPIVRKAA